MFFFESSVVHVTRESFFGSKHLVAFLLLSVLLEDKYGTTFSAFPFSFLLHCPLYRLKWQSGKNWRQTLTCCRAFLIRTHPSTSPKNAGVFLGVPFPISPHLSLPVGTIRAHLSMYYCFKAVFVPVLVALCPKKYADVLPYRLPYCTG